MRVINKFSISLAVIYYNYLYFLNIWNLDNWTTNVTRSNLVAPWRRRRNRLQTGLCRFMPVYAYDNALAILLEFGNKPLNKSQIFLVNNVRK